MTENSSLKAIFSRSKKTAPLFVLVLNILLQAGCSSNRDYIQNGFWKPIATDGLSSECLNGFLFVDSTFEYLINECDALNPLRSFGGHYQLFSDSIVFTTEYYDIIQGFNIGSDPNSAKDNGWALKNGTKVRVFLSLPSVDKSGFKQFKDTIWLEEYYIFHLERSANR